MKKLIPMLLIVLGLLTFMTSSVAVADFTGPPELTQATVPTVCLAAQSAVQTAPANDGQNQETILIDQPFAENPGTYQINHQAHEFVYLMNV
jgi:hypothetical protein